MTFMTCCATSARVNSRPIPARTAFTAGFFLFCGLMLGLRWMDVFTSPPHSLLSLVAAAWILFLPGFLISECLRPKTESDRRASLQILADAVSVSLVLEVVLAIIAFTVHATISTWIDWMTSCNVCCFTLWAWRTRWRGAVNPGVPRAPRTKMHAVDALLWLMIGFLSLELYRWADTISAIGWEVALHLGYVRHYFSNLPLDVHMMVARPGEVAPPNGFFFWEFLLAAMSRLARLDCLEFSLRSRWLIPLLGLSGLYALTFELARSKRRTSLIISIVAIAILTTFLFRPPDDFQAIVNSGNHGRIITAFMGSIHHADTAMEILLPLMLAAFFRLRRSQDLPRLIVFALFILMSFFWHPRELFQTAWIAAMMMVTDLLLQRRQVFWRLLKKVYAPAFAAYGIVVAAPPLRSGFLP